MSQFAADSRYAPATRFVLIEPSHAGNVGAAARALKVMGFDELVLVNPRWSNVLRKQETIQRASGANNVLDNTRIVATVDEALEGVEHVCATAMTPRDFGPPTRAPRAHFANVCALPAQDGEEELDQGHLRPQSVAFLFGTERYGMKNEDVYRAHVCLSIPTNPQYGSLNLAAAVQLIAYDWRQALGGFVDGGEDLMHSPAPSVALATADQVSGALAHVQQALIAIDFLDPAVPKKLMPRLQQLCNRAQLREDEVHILRGIAKAILRAQRTQPDEKG